MEIGLIGHGVVGGAVSFALQKLGYHVKIHDIKLKSSIKDLLDTEVVFVCVPTKSLPSGQCDVSVVKHCVKELINIGYDGVVAIKSTVIPGTTDDLILECKCENICFVPEFLRERCAIADFTENHDVCVIGTHSKDIFDLIKKCHGKYPKMFFKCLPIEAELSKYFCNLYNATLITFANSFYEFCQCYSADYSIVKEMCSNRNHICDEYLDCNPKIRAFGGPCLTKDLDAVIYILEQLNPSVEFFEAISKENAKYEITVFDGMRK